MKHTKISLAIASAAILAVGTQIAGATPTIRINLTDSSGTGSFYITDNELAGFIVDHTNTNADENANLGIVHYSASYGVWTVDVNTGITKPAQGAAADPYMHLNVLAMSTGKGTLTVEFSETGFGPMAPGSNYYISAGGLAAGGMTCTTLVNTSGALFGGVILAEGGSSFSTGATGTYTEPFSLTQKVVITHGTGIRTSSVDMEVGVPDGGTTLALLGGSLLGLGALRRKLVKA